MEYNLLEPWKTLDDWQQEYISTESNCFLLCGRQSGKTTAMSIKFGTRAAERPNRVILMIALTEKQAYNLFFKTLMFLEANYSALIKKGKDKPTKHQITLKNGSKIMCYAAGLKGEGIRTYTVTDLVIDEAAPMAREVFISVTPMLSVTGGTMDISSTPRGKEGYFYECSKREDFKKFYISAEDCPRHKKEFLEQERSHMSKLEFAQEYQALFLDELRQLFSDDLINSCLTLPRVFGADTTAPLLFSPAGDTFLGVDVAALGSDQSVFCSVSRQHEKVTMIDMEITTKTRITDTIDRIKILDKKYNFKKVYIDSGGLGTGVTSILLLDQQTKRKIVEINNSSRAIDRDDAHHTKLMKEDLYANLLQLMEAGKIELFKDEEIRLSLKSVQYEIEDGKPKIFGNYTHIAEALIRVAWCMKDKSLNIWIR